ncbi:MAG: trehalase family glycosidase [Prevotella sp.]|nr:trehalase family glycosidase [Prevotella sp.]
MKIYHYILILLVALCTSMGANAISRYDFPQIIDLSKVPDGRKNQVSCFIDQGSWMGFSVSDSLHKANGFRGPYSIYGRYWFAQALVEVIDDSLTPTEVVYYPGELTMKKGGIKQRLQYLDASTAILKIIQANVKPLQIRSNNIGQDIRVSQQGDVIVLTHKTGEKVIVTLPRGSKVHCTQKDYKATLPAGLKTINIGLSFASSETPLKALTSSAKQALNNSAQALKNNDTRWNGYLDRVIRQDMPNRYNRIAAKSIVTLISNWRVPRGGILRNAIIPSHSIGYFVGCWAWDCWRFSAAMASFAPELAKDNIRVMFDYQLPDGMVIDCIYPDTTENNSRDSKPPLATWAVNRIYESTKDTAFVREMYPKLLKYHRWWYAKRDHNHNGICEFGSCDGTLEAAAWESGMDNAIRFDSSKMVKNDDDAWSMDQESVDLNGYLGYEYGLLSKLAAILGEEFTQPDVRSQIADYFFDTQTNFFFDRRLSDGSFVREPGCEGYIPFWAHLATSDQFKKASNLLTDPALFSTYIPFPTIAANNPKYDPKGYWRGPIWLDQTYSAIRGFRNYGQTVAADVYTAQVFDRLQGATGKSPIYENYDTFTGAGLESANFSWSAAHLLLLYEEFGKVTK